jgi:hypothetical protein
MREDLSEAAETIQGLTRPEHLLVWALRAIAVGHGDCPLLARTFDTACGPLGAQALQSYFMLIQYIGGAGRRRLKVHVPGCACVSVDETAIVGVVAAAQASIRGVDEELLRMRLGFLVRGKATEFSVFAAQAVARVLEISGHTLPVRLSADHPRLSVAQAPLRAVH